MNAHEWLKSGLSDRYIWPVESHDELCDILQEYHEYESTKWQPINTAPKDGTPILGYCVHEEDPYYDESEERLTAYGYHCENLERVKDGVHVLVWVDGYRDDDGWESSITWYVPGCWFLTTSDSEIVANPTHWMPLPEPPNYNGERNENW
jgi:hypothetical protein